MIIKKNLLLSLLLITSTQLYSVTATASFDVPSVDSLTQAINRLASFSQQAPLITVGTVTACVSAWSLFRNYPNKDQSTRTNSDWIIPSTGIALGIALIVSQTQK